MAATRFVLIPTSHLILVRNNNILLSRRFHTGYEDGNYSMVAGHLEGNETFREAMVREAREEAGITIKPDDLTVVHVMHRKGKEERIDFFLKADRWEGEPTIQEPDKCDDLRWFPLDHLPENTVSYVRQAIECIRENMLYSEFGWE